LARCLWASGQTLEAEKYLLSAIAYQKERLRSGAEKSFRDLDAAYDQLYRLYFGVGRAGDAEMTLKQAIENTKGGPEQNGFRAELAQLLQSSGRRAEMTSVLEDLKAHSAAFPKAYEIAGGLYLKLGDFRQAIREYGEGLAKFPKEKNRYRQLTIEALLAGDRRDEAESINDSILKENPKDGDALARRAGFLIDKGDTEKSIAVLEAMLRQVPANSVIHYNLGRAMMSRNQREAARQQFTEAVRFNSKFVPARTALAQIELSTGEFGHAVTSAEQILALENKNSTAMLIRAVALRQMGKRPEARAAFEGLLALYPRFDQALLQFGIFNAMEGKTKEAEALYRKSFEANPNNLGGFLAIVQFLLSRNQPEEALKTVKMELAKHPDRADLEIALADVEMRTGHVDSAIARYQALQKKQEKKPAILGDIDFRLAECYKRQGDLRSAIAQLERARQLLPNNAPVLHNLGVIHDMLGEKAQAKTFYEAGLKIDGEDPTILNNLAFYMAENGGDLDQALTYAQRARQRMPHDPTFADTVAVIYLKKNLVDNALDILQEIVGKQPGEAVFRLHLGEALIKKGDDAKGRRELQTALASKPSPEDATTIRQLLSKSGT
jgi:tetratricopeptide (TPR) repeat protein